MHGTKVGIQIVIRDPRTLVTIFVLHHPRGEAEGDSYIGALGDFEHLGRDRSAVAGFAGFGEHHF